MILISGSPDIRRNDDGSFNKNSSLRPSKFKNAVAWQYSSKGQVPGIKGPVDLDVDFDGIVNLIGASPYKKTNEEIAQEVLQGKWGTRTSTPSRRTMLQEPDMIMELFKK